MEIGGGRNKFSQKELQSVENEDYAKRDVTWNWGIKVKESMMTEDFQFWRK